MDFPEEDGAQIYVFPKGIKRDGQFDGSSFTNKDNFKNELHRMEV